MKEMVTKIGEQRRISLHCPNCNYFGFMNVKGKTKVKKQVNYYVCCPKCGQNFKQIGRPYNFWRDIKKKYNLKHKEVRIMQKELMRKLVRDNEIKAKDRHNALEIGDVVFIKPEDDDLRTLKLYKPNGDGSPD